MIAPGNVQHASKNLPHLLTTPILEPVSGPFVFGANNIIAGNFLLGLTFRYQVIRP